MFRLILKYIYFDPKKRFVKRSKQAQFQSPILHIKKNQSFTAHYQINP